VTGSSDSVPRTPAIAEPATDVAAIERRMEFRASPERVWRALTDPGELSGCLGQRASFRPEPGADGWFEWDGEGRYAVRVEQVDSSRRTETTTGGIREEVWVSCPDRGRFAIRIDAVEPPYYIASSHTIEEGTSLADAAEVLSSQWFVKARPDGGTDVTFVEMGYLGPDRHAQNAAGWDSYLVPVIRQYLGEM